MSPKLDNSLQPTSVSVLMINAQGMMLSVLGQDYFISYNRVPWLRDARVSSVLKSEWQVRMLSNGQSLTSISKSNP